MRRKSRYRSRKATGTRILLPSWAWRTSSLTSAATSGTSRQGALLAPTFVGRPNSDTTSSRSHLERVQPWSVDGTFESKLRDGIDPDFRKLLTLCSHLYLGSLERTTWYQSPARQKNSGSRGSRSHPERPATTRFARRSQRPRKHRVGRELTVTVYHVRRRHLFLVVLLSFHGASYVSAPFSTFSMYVAACSPPEKN